MLHIVNGDSVAEKLRQGVVQDEILVWREIYSHGPVFADAAAPDNRSARAEYLEHTMGIPRSEYIQGCEQQEKTLANFHKYEQVVLWFEHDLFDQTMLCYLLNWFSGQPLLNTKLSLLCIGEYPGIELFRGLGQLSPEQLKTLVGTWQEIGTAELELGKAFWQAYTAPNLQLLRQLLNEDTSVLPFAREAFQFHLSRFPSTYNGLGIVEQTTLELIRAGINAPYELFEQVGGKLHLFGMGDLQYWHIIKKMTQEPYPLLKVNGLRAFPAYQDSPESLRDCRVAMTDFGHRVLDGEENWVTKQGIDEWYGGVHLQGKRPY